MKRGEQILNQVIFISDFDSRIAWSCGLVALFKSYCKKSILLVVNNKRAVQEAYLAQYFDVITYVPNLRSLRSYLCHEKVDVCVLALGGAAHIKVMEYVRCYYNNIKRPIFISGFNGIEDINDPHGLFCRMGTDFICFNAPVKYDYFKQLLSSLKISNRSLYLSGFVRDYWSVGRMKTENTASGQWKTVLFVLQTGIVDHIAQLKYLKEKILHLIAINPEIQILIKPRGSPRCLSVNSHLEKKYYTRFWEALRKEAPKNINITYQRMETILPMVDVVVSFTSAALIEALILGKHVIALSDFGVSRSIGNAYLLGSNILQPFDVLCRNDLPVVDEKWLISNILFSQEKVEALIHHIIDLCMQQKTQGMLPFESSFYNTINAPYLFRREIQKETLMNRLKRVFGF